MQTIAYHASHEQFSPTDLLGWAILAEQCGFTAIHCSDHFHSWSTTQQHSGYAFTWLGAAMQSTRLPFGFVCAPGQRYHPAIIAQAIATLGYMFPDRLWVSLGSGENINEHITGDNWPDKKFRNERLRECGTIIRALLGGKEVSYEGHVRVDRAKLNTRPNKPIPIFGAAVSVETAGWVGKWADGLITISRPYNELKEVVTAFRKNGGEGKPMFLKVQLSYATSEELALVNAYEQWRNNLLDPILLSDIATIEEFDALGSSVSFEDIPKKIRVSSNWQDQLQWLEQDLSLGFEHLILHNVNIYQEEFIRDFGKFVVPRLKKR